MNNDNLSTQVYQKLTEVPTMHALMNGYFRDRRSEAVTLMHRSGIAIPAGASEKTVQIAWLKAIMDSDSFRQQASKLMTDYLYQRQSGMKSKHASQMHDFVSMNMNRFYNQTGDDDDDDGDDGDDSGDDSGTISQIAPLAPVGLASTGAAPGSISGNPSFLATATVPPPASTGVTAGTQSDGSFWGSLTSIFTPAVTQAAITTGLQAVSSSLTANANATSTANALKTAQTKLATSQTQASTTNTLVLLALGAGVILVIVLVAVSSGHKHGSK